MTLDDIRIRVLDRMDESATTSLRYPDADISQYVYDGLRLYTTIVGQQTSQVTLIQTPYELFFNLPCEAIQVLRVEWITGGKYYPLAATTLYDLDGGVLNWQKMTDYRSRMYMIYGLNKIGLWPPIRSDTQSYIIHYKQDRFNDLSVMAPEDHEGLVNYAAARLLMVDGSTDDAMTEYKAFRTICDKAKSRMINMGVNSSMSSQGVM